MRRRRRPGRCAGHPDDGRGRRRLRRRGPRLLPRPAPRRERAAHGACRRHRVRRRARPVARREPRCATSSSVPSSPGSRSVPRSRAAVDAGVIAVRPPEPLLRGRDRGSSTGWPPVANRGPGSRERHARRRRRRTDPDVDIKRRVHLRLLADPDGHASSAHPTDGELRGALAELLRSEAPLLPRPAPRAAARRAPRRGRRVSVRSSRSSRDRSRHRGDGQRSAPRVRRTHGASCIALDVRSRGRRDSAPGRAGHRSAWSSVRSGVAASSTRDFPTGRASTR